MDKILIEKLSDIELKAYEDGYKHGLEKAQQIVNWHGKKLNDTGLPISPIYKIACVEIENSILCTLLRISENKCSDPTSEVM